MRVLIAEDDSHQRNALAELLSELRPNWKIVATTDTVDATLGAIEELAPDLSLIDIHLQDSSSTDWVKSLPSDSSIIYVTGDPNLAIHAFDSAAVDYVLKPITMRRLKTALDRVDAGRPRKPEFSSQETDDGIRWLSVSRGPEILVVPHEEIIYLSADLKYTRVVSQRGEGLVRAGINELSQHLADKRFIKIHRSVVVNLKFVSAVKRDELGHVNVHLMGRSETLRVSRSFYDVFKVDSF